MNWTILRREILESVLPLLIATFVFFSLVGCCAGSLSFFGDETPQGFKFGLGLSALFCPFALHFGIVYSVWKATAETRMPLRLAIASISSATLLGIIDVYYFFALEVKLWNNGLLPDLLTSLLVGSIVGPLLMGVEEGKN